MAVAWLLPDGGNKRSIIRREKKSFFYLWIFIYKLKSLLNTF